MGAQRAVVWTSTEAARLAGLVRHHGPKWALVSREMGRSRTAVRNKYIRISYAGRGVNKCRKCGLPKRGHVCTVGMLEEASEVALFDSFIHAAAKHMRIEDSLVPVERERVTPLY